MERVKGIEPSYAAWEAAVLPLNYTRESARANMVAKTGFANQEMLYRPGNWFRIRGNTLHPWRLTRIHLRHGS